MQSKPVHKVNIENWNVSDRSNKWGNGREIVTKIAVRDSRGRFHGATNFRGSVLSKK